MWATRHAAERQHFGLGLGSVLDLEIESIIFVAHLVFFAHSDCRPDNRQPQSFSVSDSFFDDHRNN